MGARRHQQGLFGLIGKARYLWAVAGGYVVVGVVILVAYLNQVAHVVSGMEDLARERGTVLFRLVELARDWNAQHGGVYVPVTEQTQPNPYLKHPRRDLVTADGQRLTLVNPAFMTRQIGEIAEKADGVKFHITSLKPIRPANKADDWERESLELFEGGLKERLSFLDGAEGGPVHRYMAPLMVKQPCMKCHAVQGYQVGDIRGGISVTMPAAKLLEVVADQKRRIAGFYVAGYVVIAALLHVVLWHGRRYLLKLADINLNQERLIRERTRDLAESESRYRAVVDSSQDGILVVHKGKVVFANARMEDLIGYTQDELTETGILAVVAPEDRDWVSKRHERRLAGEKLPTSYRMRLLHKDGHTRKVVDVNAVPRRERDGSAQIVVSFKDVTEKLSAERALQIAAAVFESTIEAIMVTDHENRIIQVNPAFTAITGYTPHEAIGRNPRMLASGRHNQDFYQEIWRHLNEVGHWEGEIWNRRKNGELYVEWLAITTIQAQDREQGRYVATFTDITKRKETEEQILHKANFDALTDLPNRHLFEDRLASNLALARRHGRKFALMYLDLDHFKEINDQFGHAAGDRLLEEVGRRMGHCVREADTVARLGGDEFAVILSDLGDDREAEEVAGRLIEALARPYPMGEQVSAHVSASVGIAVYPRDGGDDLLLKVAADSALYDAKAAGRNTYRFYAAEIGGSGG